MNEYCEDEFWNSNLTWYTKNPVLTDCFESTVLVFTPCIFLWVLFTFDVLNTKRSQSRNIPWSFVNISNLLLIGILIVLELSSILGGTIFRNDYYNSHIISSVVKIFTFALVGFLIYFNKKYGCRTSGLLFFFWLFLLICGIPRFKKEIEICVNSPVENIDERNINYFIYFILIFLCFLLQCFWVDKPPKETKFSPVAKPRPENSSNFLSKLSFHWLTFLFWKGYRKPLEEKDLWDLNNEDSTKVVSQIFDKQWEKSIQKLQSYQRDNDDAFIKYNQELGQVNFKRDERKREKHVSIFPVLIKGFGLSYLFAASLDLVQIVLTFVSPQVLSLIISYAQNKEEPWKGYLYVFLLFGVATLRTFFQNHIYYYLYLFGTRIRTSLISAIYRKSLCMSNAARREKTVGEIVTLMSVDCQRFLDVVFHLNLVWSAPLQTIIAMYFLWNELGPSCLAGLVVMILLIPINSFIVNKIKIYQVKTMKFKDRRIKLMNEMLNGIKIIKLYAWEPNFEAQIRKVREQEVEVLKKSMLLHAGSIFCFSCAPLLVAIFSFMTYVLVDESNILDAQTAFVSLSLFNILRFPLSMLPNVIASLVQLFVSIKRINSFLGVDEIDFSNVNQDSSQSHPLTIENGSFAWDSNPILKDINLRIQSAELVAIVGTVGSGKSTLISAFLGETYLISGRVNVSGNVAYVPQQAWIRNATLRDNILFGKPFNQRNYDSVVAACALKQDFEILPAGDETEIGEKGINLSGGQKQRISLARAVYADCDIYFLDDPLSAVDSHVGKHIFDNVLGPNGLLCKKTRVLVTHGLIYLPDVDQIVVLKNGKVSEVGTYHELLEKKGAFADFLIQYVTEVQNTEELEEIERQLSKTSLSEEIHKNISRKISISESDKELVDGHSKISLQNQISVGSIKRKNSTLAVKLVTPNDEKVGKKLIDKEFAAIGSVKMSVYFHYFKSVSVLLCVVISILYLLRESSNIGSNFVLNYWSDEADTLINNTQKRNVYMASYSALGFLQGFFSLFASIFLTIGCIRASIYLHNSLLQSIFHWPLNVFDITPLGRILNRFSSDVQSVDVNIPMNIEMLIIDTLKVFSTLFVICYITPIFIAVVIPISLLYVLIQRLYLTTSRQLKRFDSTSKSPIYSHFGETIAGVSSIRAYKVQNRFIKESEAKVDFNLKCFYPIIVALRWLSIRLEMIGNLVILFAALLAVIGNLSPGLVGLSLSYSNQVIFFLNMLVRNSAEMETQVVAVERIKEYEEVSHEGPWQIANTKPPPQWPKKGNIQFKNYSTRYRPGLDLILKSINFTINGGEKVGIVGRTGAGKSSLTLALFRIIEAAEGDIFIDDISIGTLGLHDLRCRITIIPQEAVLFSGTLRMNLDPFQNHSDDEIWNALELSHLKSFVREQSLGLDHEISEGGDNLSMGQKQLVCLARALLRKTKILVLDEATAAVDLETDFLIQQTIRKQFQGCTVLTIAHRLNTIIDYDRVVVLDKGRLIEYDSPNNLLANEDSVFYGMAKDAGIV